MSMGTTRLNVDRDKIKEDIWAAPLNVNAKLLMLATYHLMDSKDRLPAARLFEVKKMTKINSDDKWSQAILEALEAGYLEIEKNDDGVAVYYIVRQRDV